MRSPEDEEDARCAHSDVSIRHFVLSLCSRDHYTRQLPHFQLLRCIIRKLKIHWFPKPAFPCKQGPQQDVAQS